MSLAFYYSVMFGIKLMSYRQDVLTPDIKSVKVQEALRILHGKRLGMILLEEQFSNVIPKDLIINQFPSPGIKLKVERNVRVIVSKGKESLKVPELVGKSQKSAELTLDRFSLKKGDFIYIYSSITQKDYVISQNPLSNTLIYKGDEVDLLISKGPENKTFVMPDLIEEDLHHALNRLKTLKIQLNSVIYKYYENYPENIVINQSPDIGYPVSNDIGVTLTVNKRIVEEEKKNRFVIFRYVVPLGFKERYLELVLVSEQISRRTLKKGAFPSGYYFKHLVSAPVDSELEMLMDGKVVKRVTVE